MHMFMARERLIIPIKNFKYLKKKCKKGIILYVAEKAWLKKIKSVCIKKLQHKRMQCNGMSVVHRQKNVNICSCKHSKYVCKVCHNQCGQMYKKFDIYKVQYVSISIM